MSKYERYGETGLDTIPEVNGDVQFLRVVNTRDPGRLDSGELAEARNIRLETRRASVRMGMKKLAGAPTLVSETPLVLSFMLEEPWPILRDVYSNGVYAVGVYAWPEDEWRQYLVFAAAEYAVVYDPDGESYITVPYATGHVIEPGDVCTLTEANKRIFLYRGFDKVVLEWDGDSDGEFTPVAAGAHPDGGTFIHMPNAPWSMWYRNRMVLPYKPDAGDDVWELLLSDIGDPDTYDTQWAQFRFEHGTGDTLVAGSGYMEDHLIVGCRHSMHLIRNVSGDLADSTSETITRNFGVVNRRGMLVLGNRVFVLSLGAVYALEVTTELKLRGYDQPISDAVSWFADGVNWDAAEAVAYVFNVGARVGFAVPWGTSTRVNRVLWYNLMNETEVGRGWESMDTFPAGFYPDAMIQRRYEGRQRVFAVSFEGGISLMDEREDGVDEVQGVGSGSVLAEVPIDWRVLTREYSQTNAGVERIDSGSVRVSMDDEARVVVRAHVRDTATAREVATLTGAAGMPDLRRFPVRLRGSGMQVELAPADTTSGGSVELREVAVLGSERSRRGVAYGAK